MCTSIALEHGGFYFGRNLDLETDFGQRVVITPRRHVLRFRRVEEQQGHYAMIGMATVMDGYPLYADAMNERGLCVAGLNFPDYAHYPSEGEAGKAHVAPFELPLWLLSQCATLAEARALLERTEIIGLRFSEDIPVSPLHWHVADRTGSLAVECMRGGMLIHENPVGVLTNSPPFDFHMHNLTQYMGLTACWPVNRISADVALHAFSRGMGAFGLPGDASSPSRFVRAAFNKLNSVCEAGGEVGQLFHLLDSVAMPRGSVMAPDGRWEQTLYACCMDADEGVYYYKTYGNNALTVVHLHSALLDGEALLEFPLEMQQHILHAN